MAFVPQLSVPQNGMECRMIQNSQSCVIDKHINESQHNMPQGKHCEFSFFCFLECQPSIKESGHLPSVKDSCNFTSTRNVFGSLQNSRRANAKSMKDLRREEKRLRDEM